jgi:hypothetical protein
MTLPLPSKNSPSNSGKLPSLPSTTQKFHERRPSILTMISQSHLFYKAIKTASILGNHMSDHFYEALAASVNAMTARVFRSRVYDETTLFDQIARAMAAEDFGRLVKRTKAFLFFLEEKTNEENAKKRINIKPLATMYFGRYVEPLRLVTQKLAAAPKGRYLNVALAFNDWLYNALPGRSYLHDDLMIDRARMALLLPRFETRFALLTQIYFKTHLTTAADAIQRDYLWQVITSAPSAQTKIEAAEKIMTQTRAGDPFDQEAPPRLLAFALQLPTFDAFLSATQRYLSQLSTAARTEAMCTVLDAIDARDRVNERQRALLTLTNDDAVKAALATAGLEPRVREMKRALIDASSDEASNLALALDLRAMGDPAGAKAIEHVLKNVKKLRDPQEKRQALEKAVALCRLDQPEDRTYRTQALELFRQNLRALPDNDQPDAATVLYRYLATPGQGTLKNDFGPMEALALIVERLDRVADLSLRTLKAQEIAKTPPADSALTDAMAQSVYETGLRLPDAKPGLKIGALRWSIEAWSGQSTQVPQPTAPWHDAGTAEIYRLLPLFPPDDVNTLAVRAAVTTWLESVASPALLEQIQIDREDSAYSPEERQVRAFMRRFGMPEAKP